MTPVTVWEPAACIASTGSVQLRQAEVENLHGAIRPEKHVVGLEVSVDDAARVRGREATRDSERHGEGLVQRKRSRVETLAQALSFQAFRHEERCALVLADVVDRENVGVIERAGRSRFLCEAAETLGDLWSSEAGGP